MGAGTFKGLFITQDFDVWPKEKKKLKRFEDFESIWVFVTVWGVFRHTTVVLSWQVVHSPHKVPANAKSELSWGLRDHWVCMAKNAPGTLRLCTDPWWNSLDFWTDNKRDQPLSFDRVRGSTWREDPHSYPFGIRSPKSSTDHVVISAISVPAPSPLLAPPTFPMSLPPSTSQKGEGFP